MQGNFDIFLIDTTRGPPRRFTFDPAIDGFPVWSPDGSRLVFSSNRKGAFGLFEKPASLARDEQELLVAADNKYAVDWSPDGRVLLYVNQDSVTGDDLWALPLEGAPTPVPVVRTTFLRGPGTVLHPTGAGSPIDRTRQGRVRFSSDRFRGRAASASCQPRAGASRAGGATARSCSTSRQTTS